MLPEGMNMSDEDAEPSLITGDYINYFLNA